MNCSGSIGRYYYQAAPASALNLQLMRLVDEQFLRTPFYGWQDDRLNLLRHQWQAGQTADAYDGHSSFTPGEASSPGEQILIFCATCRLPTSTSGAQTSMLRGFMYLSLSSTGTVAMNGRHPGRHLLSRCPAPSVCKGRPQIFNTDQGAQFTADAFTTALCAANIQVAWTAAAAPLTTSSANAYGAASNMRTSISTSMTQCVSCKLG